MWYPSSTLTLFRILLLWASLLMACPFVLSTPLQQQQHFQSPITLIQYGDNLPSGVREEIHNFLTIASQYPIEVYPTNERIPVSTLPQGSFAISLGSTATSPYYIPEDELEELGSEGFIAMGYHENITFFVGNGNPNSDLRYQFNSSIGASYASYAILEELGFAFLHPLQPIVPFSLVHLTEDVVLKEKPYWPIRNFHLHTMHPIELTDLLQGRDIVTQDYEQTFESMLPEWVQVMNWFLANRQNQVEWVMLIANSWGEWARSPERQARFRQLTDICHKFGIACGADAPLALIQQHAFTLIETFGDLETELADIRRNVDYFIEAGFDFLTTENGFAEFIPADCARALRWMDEFAIYSHEKYGVHTAIKIHCSTGQVCPDFEDPATGEPLNFNFLPMFADSRLGHLPHTVQMYSVHDPAPTYGNTNFSYIFDFMFRNPDHDQIFYPESSYWVNYDTQIPLFLPVYAMNRLRDLRMIAAREIQDNYRIKGQMLFDSGWEWGYWLQDVISARAVWNPFVEEENDLEALRKSLWVVVRPFGESGSKILDFLVDLSVDQQNLLVLGLVNGKAPEIIEKRNGIAYLEGWDTWADFGTKFESFLATQPKHLGLLEVRHRLRPDPNYNGEVQPLLEEMENTFSKYVKWFEELEPDVPANALNCFQDISQGTKMLAIRARHVWAVYDYAATARDGDTNWRQERLATARNAIDEAELIIRERENNYRLPLKRLAGWRDFGSTTVYRYMYLWQVHSLYYYWRDYDRAEARGKDVYSFCYMNVIDPIKVAFGEGAIQNFTEALREWFDENQPGNHFIVDCLAAPLSEPHYPLEWEYRQERMEYALTRGNGKQLTFDELLELVRKQQLEGQV